MFNKAVENMISIQNMFARRIGENNLDIWRPSSFQGYQSVDLSNRYFTCKRDDPNGTVIPFSSGIDPHGKLSALGGNNLFHGEDNHVLYFEQLPGTTR
jgi:hypothetical protein